MGERVIGLNTKPMYYIIIFPHVGVRLSRLLTVQIRQMSAGICWLSLWDGEWDGMGDIMRWRILLIPL